MQAICPTRGSPALSVSEILRKAEERLEMDDLQTEECYKFKIALLEFFQKRADSMRKTRSVLGLSPDATDKENPSIIERIAAEISGLTLCQFEVRMLCKRSCI